MSVWSVNLVASLFFPWRPGNGLSLGLTPCLPKLAWIGLMISRQPPTLDAPSDRLPIGAVLTSVPDGRLAFSAPRCWLLVVAGDLDCVVEMTDLDRPVAEGQRDVGVGDAHLIFSADTGV